MVLNKFFRIFFNDLGPHAGVPLEEVGVPGAGAAGVEEVGLVHAEDAALAVGFGEGRALGEGSIL